MNFVLSKDTLLAANIVSGLLDEPVVGVTPMINRGSVNTVFVVDTVNQKVVVRMSGRGEAFNEYTKEAWCIERAAARGVSVPSVIGVGRSEGSAHIVQSHIEGEEGRISPLPKLYIWRELGKYAKLIHSIPVRGFGLELSEITRGDVRKSWLQYLEYNIENLSEDDLLIKLKVLTWPQSKVIKRIFAELRRREFTFGLNHGDISLKNTVVERSGRVSLLDWGSAEAAVVPHHDLIQMLKMRMLEGDPDNDEILAFLEGYGISPVEYQRIMPVLEKLLVLRAFDKLRWALEWNAADVGRYIKHAREALSRCLSRS